MRRKDRNVKASILRCASTSCSLHAVGSSTAAVYSAASTNFLEYVLCPKVCRDELAVHVRDSKKREKQIRIDIAAAEATKVMESANFNASCSKKGILHTARTPHCTLHALLTEHCLYSSLHTARTPRCTLHAHLTEHCLYSSLHTARTLHCTPHAHLAAHCTHSSLHTACTPHCTLHAHLTTHTLYRLYEKTEERRASTTITFEIR